MKSPAIIIPEAMTAIRSGTGQSLAQMFPLR
jgi:hypothetical protein